MGFSTKTLEMLPIFRENDEVSPQIYEHWLEYGIYPIPEELYVLYPQKFTKE